jgi:hypothetical protein
LAADSLQEADGLRRNFISKSENRQALKQLYRSIYFLAKEHIANVKFKNLRQLLIESGCTFIKQLDASGNANYTSSTFHAKVVAAISDILEADILEMVHTSPAYGLTIDESQDAAIREIMDLYWKCVDMKSGDTKAFFAGLRACKNGTADHLSDLTLKFIASKGENVERALGFASDGAAAMFGTDNGVATQMQRANPRGSSSPIVATTTAWGGTGGRRSGIPM